MNRRSLRQCLAVLVVLLVLNAPPVAGLAAGQEISETPAAGTFGPQELAVPERDIYTRADLDAADLRRIEALASLTFGESEVSRLNRAGAGVAVRLSKDVRSILLRARELVEATEGAFDVTCLPLIELWRDAVRRGWFPRILDWLRPF